MKKGFTLSETLITLVVIGIVAAITVPVIHSNWQKERTLSALKKSYSVFANATQLAISSEGPMKSWEIQTAATGAWSFVETYILPFVNIQHNCDVETTGACEFKYTTLNRQQTGILDSSNYRFSLMDGTRAAVRVTRYTENGKEKIKPILTVDINGDASPNMYGRDIFVFEYYDDGNSGKLVAYKEPELTREQVHNSDENACNRNAKGEYCAAMIMKDGWKFEDDYPW